MFRRHLNAASNPPCPLPWSWDAAVSGAGISAIVYRDAGAVTEIARKKSGADESQSATIKRGQTVRQLDFLGVWLVPAEVRSQPGQTWRGEVVT